MNTDNIIILAITACIINAMIILGALKGCEYTENTNQEAIEHGLIPDRWKSK